ncbi:MAG: hypothetical protein ACYS1A_07565 [Planctomycetota bacterium]
MRSRKLTFVAVLVFTVISASCGLKTEQKPFSPGPLTPALLADAAASAGFKVNKVEADIPRSVRPRLPWKTFAYDDSLIAPLRDRYKLNDLVKGAKNEWQGQLALKHWVNSRITNGTPSVQANHAVDILKHAAEGKEFWCTFYAITYIECAQALGWQARKVCLDIDHGLEGEPGSQHHGAAEVWSNYYRKWVFMDAQSDLHFEKDGLPLSAWEVRSEWLRNEGADVDHVVGMPFERQLKNPAIVWWSLPDKDETGLFFWLIYYDNYATWEEDSPSKWLFPQDSAHAGKTWYQGGEKRHLHAGYEKKLFLPTERIEDVYWTVGVVEASVAGVSRGKIILSLDSYCPDFSSYEINTEGDSWRKPANPSRFAWLLKKGSNRLAIRTVNKGGVAGTETSLHLILE